ncbi:cyclopropane-fatty-acyl-phospholipid synthase family protein [Sphingomonas oligophenolica]|uniref:Cyclopropane-fatty-acyl-phospholipid synthase family protein n=1 Tax=Sphingomonas oligophenolica TaxID=301154 RepID=A0ABU9Y182_9SPHN
MPGKDQSRASLPLLGALLPDLIRVGELTIIDARGGRSRFGPGGSGPKVVIRLHDRLLPIRLALDPMLATGEAYMDGSLTVEQGDVRDFLLVATTGLESVHRTRSSWVIPTLLRLGERLTPANGRRRARRNVEHHYDLPPELYDLFLDRDHLYSCAYFRTGSESLEEAQQAKMQHIMAKLLLGPDKRVLDIGCGWGALATTIVEETGASVTGLTLSAEQLASANARAQRRHVADKAQFVLRDYRDEQERYDRIVSVGMLEHVGRHHLDAYFSKVAGLLEEDGVGLIHSIGSAIGASDPRASKDRWMDRYIFPGGYIPALSDVMPAAERAGLWITDVEVLRLHYAETLRCWWERFQARRGEAAALMGERFCRMWEFYLASAETGFRNGRLMVFQLQLSRSREAVPLTRDYIAEAEGRFETPAGRRRVGAA